MMGKRLLFSSAVGRKRDRAGTSSAHRNTGKTLSNANRGANTMALTKSFRETVQKRVKDDPAFRAHLLEEALNCFLAGDIDTGKNLLRDYLNATESTHIIADKIETNVKSLQRMVGPKGNPTTRNLFLIFNACTSNEGIKIKAYVTPDAEVTGKRPKRSLPTHACGGR
jgi:hypothetical protein